MKIKNKTDGIKKEKDKKWY